MNKETIEQAAKENASTHFGLINKEWWARKNGFEDGARWRINAVWHDAKTETPVRNGYIAVLCPNGVMETMWYNAGIGFDETRLRTYDMWAYVSNLTPDRKGGEKCLNV